MSDLRSASYWVGHFLAIIGTIVGVYLAGVVGFKAALKLELLESDRSTYYVAESLHKELSFNVQNMDIYIQRTAKVNNVFREHVAGIELNEFVFNAAKFSDSTFEIEPQLLTEVSNYYFSVGGAIRQYYDSDKKSPATLMKVVNRETKQLKEQKTLARLEQYSKALAKLVEERGVSVDQPSFSN